MAENNHQRNRDKVYVKWISRPENQRRPCDTETFSDEMWASGHRLSSSQHNHYQTVMDIIRPAIIDKN